MQPDYWVAIYCIFWLFQAIRFRHCVENRAGWKMPGLYFLQYPDGEKYWNTINWVEADVVQKEGWPNMSGGLTMFITVLLWCLFRGRIGCI